MDGRESRRTLLLSPTQTNNTLPFLAHLGRRNCAVRLDPAHAQPPLASRRWLTVDHRRAILQHFTPHGSSFSHTRGQHSLLLLLRPLLKSGARKKRPFREKTPPPIVARVPQPVPKICFSLCGSGSTQESHGCTADSHRRIISADLHVSPNRRAGERGGWWVNTTADRWDGNTK